jgi:hypothetical protein
MKRFIRSSRKSRENLTARIKSSDAFSRSQGHERFLCIVCHAAPISGTAGSQELMIASCIASTKLAPGGMS